MKNYKDDDEDYFWENQETQEDAYPQEYEKDYGNYFGSDRDQEHEKRKRRAVLYIRLHFDELMENEAYKIAYYKLIDEMARDNAYVCGKPLTVVTEKERETQNKVLDFEIAMRTKRMIERYKDDAVYMVDWVKSGKSLLVYI